MKWRLLLLTFFVMLSSFKVEAAKVREGGNGGDAVICTMEDGSKEYYLLDYYEGLNNSRAKINLGPAKDFMGKVYYAIGLFEEKERRERYKKLADKFMSEVAFVERDLVDIPDHGDVYIEDNCVIKQTIVQHIDFENDFRTYVVDKRIWKELSEETKAGFILHEIIYNEAILLDHEDSIVARKINFALSVGRISWHGDNMREPLWALFFKEHEKCDTYDTYFPYVGGIKLQWAKRSCRNMMLWRHAWLKWGSHPDQWGDDIDADDFRKDRYANGLFNKIWNSIDLGIDEGIMYILMDQYSNLFRFKNKFSMDKLKKKHRFVQDLLAYYESSSGKQKYKAYFLISKLSSKELGVRLSKKLEEDIFNLSDDLIYFCKEEKWRCTFPLVKIYKRGDFDQIRRIYAHIKANYTREEYLLIYLNFSGVSYRDAYGVYHWGNNGSESFAVSMQNFLIEELKKDFVYSRLYRFIAMDVDGQKLEQNVIRDTKELFIENFIEILTGQKDDLVKHTINYSQASWKSRGMLKKYLDKRFSNASDVNLILKMLEKESKYDFLLLPYLVDYQHHLSNGQLGIVERLMKKAVNIPNRRDYFENYDNIYYDKFINLTLFMKRITPGLADILIMKWLENQFSYSDEVLVALKVSMKAPSISKETLRAVKRVVQTTRDSRVRDALKPVYEHFK